MPGLFSRRRGSSNPPIDSDTRAAATAAAGSAFLSSSQSQASLSSAAAAAALRSQTTSPEPVGSIQTKRMVRRGSGSSVGSSVVGGSTRGGGARGGLQRTASGGSMTERTFRSPSPGRNGSVSDAVSSAPDAPPVPALPKEIPGGHQRSSSMDPPQRIMSPASRGRGGRGSSLDRASLPPPATPRQGKKLSNVAEREEMDRQSSNPSVNFSRPRTSAQSSPVTQSPATPAAGAKKYTHGTGSWFSQPSGSKNTANARPSTADGSRSRTRPAQDEPFDPVMVYDPNSRTFVAQPRKQVQDADPPSPTPAAPTYDANSRSFVPAHPGPPQTASGASTPRKKPRPNLSPVETQLEPPPRNPARLSPTSSTSPSSPRAFGMLHKQPSVVREDREAEEAEDATASPVIPPMNLTSRTIQTSAGPAKSYIAPRTQQQQHQRSTSLDVPRQMPASRGRNISSSPSRSAHFSPSPVIEATRHEPPPRSISPVKSALKHSPASSVRTSSPMATFSPAGPRAPASEISDITSEASEEGGYPRKEKKRVRVSFDEQPHEINPAGAAATPKAISTVEKAALGSTRERSPGFSSDDDLEAEMMKPRPALPSFGSVRRARAGSPPEKVTEMAPERDGASVDRALGGILVNAKQRGTSQQQEIPLPPEVTSKEGVGDFSEESEEEESSFRPDVVSTPAKTGVSGVGGVDAGLGAVVNPVQPRRVSVDELDPKTREFAADTVKRLGQDAEVGVPAIQLQPPTPGDEAGKELGPVEEESKKVGVDVDVEAEAEMEAVREQRPTFEIFNVPGSWAEESGDEKSVSAPTPAQQQHPAAVEVRSAAAPEPSSAPPPPTAEPKTLTSDLVSVVPVGNDPAPPILGSLTEESDDGEFSDAAEDLSDLEDGGFASLDAIVTSPVTSPAAEESRDKILEAPESPTVVQAVKRQQGQSDSEEVPRDWTQATAYWSQLSRVQRDQIEKEHLSDDETAPPRSRPAAGTKKKSALKKTAVKSTPREDVGTAAEGRQVVGGQAQGQGQAQQRSMPKTMRAKAGTAGVGPGAGGSAGSQADGEVHMRRSMRGPPAGSGGGGGGGGAMPTTMRGGPQQRPQSEYFAPRRSDDGPARPKSSGGPAPSKLGPGGLPLPPPLPRQGRSRTDSDGSAGMAVGQSSAFPKMQQGRGQPPAGQQQRVQQPRPAPSASSGGAFTTKLQKQVTNDSDSESSFKKKRRASQSTMDSGGRYNMRRSMRAGSIDTIASMNQRPTSPTPAGDNKRGGGAFSIRSLSPSGGGVFGRGKGEKLRSSLRSGSVDASAPAAGGRMTTLRSSQQMPAPTMRAAPRPATASSAAPPSRSGFRSRFGADSDDEDERDRTTRRPAFRSRFVDSDEEDDGAGAASPPLRPVRGIPRRAGRDDGDSTDLEDEDENDARGQDPVRDSRKRARQSKPMVPDAGDVEKAMEAARRKLGIPAVGSEDGAVQQARREGEGEALGKGSLRNAAPAEEPKTESQTRPAGTSQIDGALPPEKQKKRGLMSSLLRRNRSSQVSIPQVVGPGSPAPASPATAPPPLPSSPLVGSPAAKAQQTNISAPPSPSVGKLVRRRSDQPKMQRGESSYSTATAPPVSSSTSALVAGGKDNDHWPLPPPVPTLPDSPAAKRPSTSDGVSIKLPRPMRPNIGTRTASGQPLVSGAGAGTGSTTGRSVGFAAGSKEEDASEGPGAYSRKTGKKKKFGLLRRAFGLYD